jgi:hypothetical protein
VPPIHEWRLREEPGGWVIDPLNGEVTQLRIDYAFTVVIDAAIELRVESGLAYFDGTATHRIPPEDPPAVAPLLTLTHATATRLDLRDTGILTIEFEDGRRLRVEPDAAFESFSLGVPREATSGALFIGLIGGGVSAFGADKALGIGSNAQ